MPRKIAQIGLLEVHLGTQPKATARNKLDLPDRSENRYHSPQASGSSGESPLNPHLPIEFRRDFSQHPGLREATMVNSTGKLESDAVRLDFDRLNFKVSRETIPVTSL